MKVLFYSHFFPPETGAASVRANYFAKTLKEAGHKVLVIAPKPNYPLSRIFDGYNKKFIVKDKQKNVVYLPILAVSSHSPFGRLISYLSYSLFSFFYLLFNSYRPDIVISSSPPIFTSFAALIYSKIKRSQFIFDIRDVWPDIGVELGILKSKIFIAGLKKIEKNLLNNSSKIIVTANGDKHNILSKVNDQNKCEIIFNGADTEIFKPISEDEKKIIRNKNDIPINKKVVIYFGSYNHGMNDINMLGKFLRDEKVAKQNIHFLSIGSGDNLQNLLKNIKSNITYTSFESLPMEEVAVLIAASDISIIPRKNLQNDTGGNIPVKCFESWAAGIPVLLSNIQDAEITNIFNRCNSGVLVEPNDIKALIDGLYRIINQDPDNIKLNARNFVIENFDRKKQSKKLLRIIEN